MRTSRAEFWDGLYRLKSLIPLFIFSMALACSANGSAKEEPADWWKTQVELSSVLMEKGNDIAKLAVNAGQSPSRNGQEALFKLSLFMRTGMNAEAIRALHELKAFYPRLENFQIAGIYYDACDTFFEWDVANATAEIFADNISELTLYNRLLQHFLDSGWSVEKVDEWLARKPNGVGDYWLKERLSFNIMHGRGDSLMKEFSERVRKNPQDIEGAIKFLDILVYAPHDPKKRPDLTWMAEVINPKRATLAKEIAFRLAELANWPTAVKFYRQAIEIPLTKEEVKGLGMKCQMFMADEMIRAIFAAQIREGIARCLLETGQKDEAQKWMIEALDIRKDHNLGRTGRFAGEVQAASGRNTIENRIREEEKISRNDPEYWLERAGYYQGRKDPVQEENALKQGLSIAKPQPESARTFKGHRDLRGALLRSYADFLARENRQAQAAALLHKEMETSPITSESVKTAAMVLASEFREYVRADDEVLWTWLAGRTKWDYPADRVLGQMLTNSNPNDLGRYFSKAEKMAEGKDISRSFTLGRIMCRRGFPERAIPLLEYVAANADDKELKDQAEFTLFESYLNLDDWKQAEKYFPKAAKKLTPGELPKWYSRVALIAAKTGAKADALRIWSGVANLNPSQIDGLEDLSRAGLRKELMAFYREMHKKMPSSQIPARALAVLEKSPEKSSEIGKKEISGPGGMGGFGPGFGGRFGGHLNRVPPKGPIVYKEYSTEELVELTGLLRRFHRLKEVVEAGKAALSRKLTPDQDARVLRNMGYAYEHLPKCGPLALEKYGEVLKRHPDFEGNIAVAYRLGELNNMIHLEGTRQNIPRAIECYEFAVKCGSVPGKVYYTVLAARNSLANLYCDQKNFAKAKEHLEAIYRSDPNLTEPLPDKEFSSPEEREENKAGLKKDVIRIKGKAPAKLVSLCRRTDPAQTKEELIKLRKQYASDATVVKLVDSELANLTKP